MSSQAEPRNYYFGPFRFHADTSELSRRGVRLRLQPQPARMLRLLLSRPGQLVTRELMQQELWGDGTLVDYELGVNRCVRQLRSALSDDSEIPRYIRTVPRMGYCFVAPVRGPQAAEEPKNSVAAVVPVVAPQPVSTSAASGVADAASIVVLPFANLTGDPQDEYFCDGLAEEITNVLAQIGSLKVIARTSAFAFKGRNEDIRKIAETLGVNHVLEGSVRRFGTRVRVTAQLIRSSDGAHLTSKRYDCDNTDLFALQDAIAGDIAEQFRLRLKPHTEHSRHLGAFEAFLEGRFHWHTYTPAGFDRALALYRRALDLDPQYGAALTGVAECYLAMVIDASASARELLPKAAEAAQAALDLDGTDAGAHAALGQVAAMLDYDWASAGKHFECALQQGANTQARLAYVLWYLLPLGRVSEAIAQCDRVICEDPRCLILRTVKATALLWARKYDEGLDCCHMALEIDHGFGKALQIQTYLLGMQGRHEEAIACAQRLVAILGPSHLSLFTLGRAYAASGVRAQVDQVLSDTESLPRGSEGSPAAIASIHMLLKDADGAMKWMSKAIDQRDPRALWMHTHPWSAEIRSDLDYRGLMEMIGLPASV